MTIQNIVHYYFYINRFQTISLVYISTGKYPFLSNFVDLEKRLLYNTFNEGNDCYGTSNRVLLKYFTRGEDFTHRYINKRFSCLSSYRLVNVQNPRLFLDFAKLQVIIASYIMNNGIIHILFSTMQTMK